MRHTKSGDIIATQGDKTLLPIACAGTDKESGLVTNPGSTGEG